MAYISQIKLSDTTYDISAIKLKNARTLTIGAKGKTFDGTANVSWTPYEMKVTRAQYGVGSNMNQIAEHGCELGMADLSGTDTTINPGGGTSWHHYINMTWANTKDNDGSTTNEWCTQIANKAGSTDLWIRSRSGGSITDGTAWAAPWTRILTGSNYTNVLDGKYVKKSGDTMSGLLKAHGGISLNSSTAESTGLTYVLGIKAFADGGNIVWSSAGNVSVGAANKLNSDAGSSTKAIYFSGGKPVQCNSTIAHDITGNAATATAFNSARTIALSGAVTGSVSSNGASGWSITTSIAEKAISPTNFTTTFRTQTKGDAGNGPYFSVIRNDNSDSWGYMPIYGSGIAFGRHDTQTYLYTSYSGAQAYIGGGNANNLNWVKRIAFTDGTAAYGTWGISITGSSASCTGNAATATTAAKLGRSGDTAYPMTFNWSGQSGQPSWLWGGNDGTNMYVYNPSNFSVNYANSAGNADTTDGLHVHGGRNNEANKIVRTDGSGYIQCGYINSSNGNEGNNSSPPRVWGTNGSDNYLRTYLTSALSVGYAASAGSVAWGNVSGKPSSYPPSSHSHSNITYTDTRSDNQSPDATVEGLSVHLKANGTDSLSDGDTYHAILNVKDWGDYSGGPYWQATVTANDNMYYRRSTSGTAWGSWRKVWARGDSVTGAVWNDYAEYRESDCGEFGYVLMETGDDSLTKTTERLSHFAGVSSDTWGFSQGETDKAKTPIAVAGRVLVYPYQDRNNYKPGDCVCAAPGGTVDIMTREEVREWPDRIVGTVSCVPNYEEWGGGEGADRDPVKVNGRIWIKVK